MFFTIALLAGKEVSSKIDVIFATRRGRGEHHSGKGYVAPNPRNGRQFGAAQPYNM